MTVIGGGFSARYLEHRLYRHMGVMRQEGRNCRRWVETVRGKTRRSHLGIDDDLECIAPSSFVLLLASHSPTKHALK